MQVFVLLRRTLLVDFTSREPRSGEQ